MFLFYDQKRNKFSAENNVKKGAGKEGIFVNKAEPLDADKLQASSKGTPLFFGYAF